MSLAFGQAAKEAGIARSMGSKGDCYDNAVAESFFATLKSEIGTRVWTTRAEARRAVFAYLTYYNHHRAHTGRTMAGRCPADVVYGARKMEPR